MSERGLRVSALLSGVSEALCSPMGSSEADVAIAIEALAERLHWKQDHLDPAPELRGWSDLDESEREFYRLSVRALLDERDLMLTALAAPPA